MLLLTSLEQGNRGRYTHIWAIWILRASILKYGIIFTFVCVVLVYPPLVLGVILRKGSLLYQLKIQVRIAYMPICTTNKSPVKTELSVSS